MRTERQRSSEMRITGILPSWIASILFAFGQPWERSVFASLTVRESVNAGYAPPALIASRLFAQSDVIRGDFKPDRVVHVEDYENGCLRACGKRGNVPVVVEDGGLARGHGL